MMTDPGHVAEQILRSHTERRRFEPLAAKYGISDLGTAYDIQDEVVRRRSEERRAHQVGYKIGLTTARMQQMCGVDSPLSGVVIDTHVYRSGAKVPLSPFVRLGIEFEVAVRVGRDITQAPATPDDARAFVDAICPALELIEDRDADYKTLDALSLVADNSWNAGIILGDFQTSYPDPGQLPAEVALNGKTIDQGNSREALGNPFAAVIWLVKHLATRGKVLRRGDIVMTGSIVPTRFPKPDEHYRLTLNGVEAVEVIVTA